MASLFRDFSFDPVSPPAYSLYEAERAAMNVSPSSQAVDGSSPFSRPPTPPCTIGDLAAQLNQQSLRINTNIKSASSGLITPPSDVCASPAEEAPPTAQPTYSRISASVLRMQRQSNSRMQCSSSHLRDLSKLVKMIEQQAQCNVNTSPSCSSTRTCSTASSCSSGDDEGVDMDYDTPARGIELMMGTTQWRSGEIREGSVRVTKPVRMRKRSNQNGVCKRRPL